jgi:DNA-binding XRE family transcriptional regulator
MPNIAAVLKEEIARLARREIRKQMHPLKKASAQYRRDIAEMKRRVSDLQGKLGPLQKQVLQGAQASAASSEGNGVRFTAKGLRSQRQRLGLSAADYGKLVGVTGQTIYSWEHETARPRKAQVVHLAALRHLGKRDARARLEQFKAKGKGKK